MKAVLAKLGWLLPVVLAAGAGVALAVRDHGSLPLSGGVEQAPAARAGDTLARQAPATSGPSPEAARQGKEAPSTARRASEAASASSTSARLEQRRQALMNRAGENVEGALGALLALGEQQRQYLQEDVVRRAAREAPELTLEWVRVNVADDEVREQLLAAAYAGIAVEDPIFALNGVQSLTDTEMQRIGRLQVLEAWAAVDAPAALQWVRSQSGDQTGDLLATVMRPYMETAPQEAGEIIAALPGGPTRARLQDSYAHHLAESDAVAALDWLAQSDPEGSNDAAMAAVFDQWAERDPWAALEYASARIDGEASVELVGRIAAGVGATEPRTLADSIGRLPEDYRAPAAERLAGTWAYQDRQRARDWAQGLPPGDVRDSAIRGILEVAKHHFPEDAPELVDLISTAEQREALTSELEAQANAAEPESGA